MLGGSFMGELKIQDHEYDNWPTITKLSIADDVLTADMSDGRAVSIPIAWFERLRKAARDQLLNFEISPSGYGIHWPDLDEDISVKSFLFTNFYPKQQP